MSSEQLWAFVPYSMTRVTAYHAWRRQHQLLLLLLQLPIVSKPRCGDCTVPWPLGEAAPANAQGLDWTPQKPGNEAAYADAEVFQEFVAVVKVWPAQSCACR